MAIKSTIFKAQLQIADIDHSYYADHAFTLARHPSETDERMMVRLVAMALHAHELQDTCHGDGHLLFGAGLSDPNEPDVLLRDFTGRPRWWIEVGQPDEKRLLRTSARVDRMSVYSFGAGTPIWWKGLETRVTRLRNLVVWQIPSEQSQSLATLAQRTMELQVTVQDGSIWVGDGTRSVEVVPKCLWDPAGG